MDFDNIPNIVVPGNYDSLVSGDLKHYFDNDYPIVLFDDLGGFDKSLNNKLFDYLKSVNCDKEILTEYAISDELITSLSPLNVTFYAEMKDKIDLTHTLSYTFHPDIKFDNFLCSFNNSDHIGRQVLVSFLSKFGLFDEKYCSKYFTNDSFYAYRILDALNIPHDDILVDMKFLLSVDDSFLSSTFTFDDSGWDFELENSEPYGISAMVENIYKLENKLTQSFVHVVSESKSHTYYPFITEKFLYSIVTRGLFVTYGQPQWHSHVEEYYGFKKYDKIFDYSFDEIQNPISRALSLVSMIHKFSLLSVDDWNDLYQMESDTIEYNYDHYFSKNYRKYMDANA